MVSSPARPPDPPAPLNAPRPRLRRLPLGASRRRISYERRVRVWLSAFALLSLVLAALLIHALGGSWLVSFAGAAALAFAWLLAGTVFFDQLTRPLQTLSNVVSALREEDFSFRARGARRGDSLGDLALEVNALAGTLQRQRSSAMDALTLLQLVMGSMPSPVLAFDQASHLRLLNPAAETVFRLHRRDAIGQRAASLGLEPLLAMTDQGIYGEIPSAGDSRTDIRWSVRRSTFRLHGIPHSLFVLSDVAAALREEERLAWQRLIRVLSHEINNSLTPIKSLAGSLRSRLDGLAFSSIAEAPPEETQSFSRGLTVIEERAASLNRFLQAYQQLTRLPPPVLQPVALADLAVQVAALEMRVPVAVEPGPPLAVLGDPDQLQQLLINLTRNAAEAALGREALHASPVVVLTWSRSGAHVLVHVRDNGPGLTNPANLFVPFYTTKAEGSGIGLVLAQQIAAAHHGVVSLSNNPDGCGCTAELRLPIASLAPRE